MKASSSCFHPPCFPASRHIPLLNFLLFPRRWSPDALLPPPHQEWYCPALPMLYSEAHSLLPIAVLQQTLLKEQPGERLKEFIWFSQAVDCWKNHLKLLANDVLRKNTALSNFGCVQKKFKIEVNQLYLQNNRSLY